jgi:hypothetical protein
MNPNTNAPLVQMGETDPDALVTAAMRERYAMPAVVVAALKQSGKRLAVKMMALIESEKFDRLPIDTQLRVTEFVYDRAFGKAESASSSLALQHRIEQAAGGPQDAFTNGKRLKELEGRIQFPEMRKVKSAKISTVPASPPSDTYEGGEVIAIPDYFKSRKVV